MSKTTLAGASLTVLFHIHSAVTRQAGQATDPIRQELENGGDALYTLSLSVGGQDIRSIPDSGSFDLLVFSSRCKTCGVRHPYNDALSKTYRTSKFVAQQTFGSGTTQSLESFDVVEVASMRVRRQVFWEVNDADSGFSEMIFGSILGIGPPSSAATVAEREANSVGLEKAKKRVVEPSAIEQHYTAVLERTRHQNLFLQEVGIRRFSICLEPNSGSPGTLIWNDNAPLTQPELFYTMKAADDVYWSSRLTSVRLSESAFGGKPIGCTRRLCSAVFDSGTSLLVIPKAAYQTLRNMADKVNRQEGCQDLSFLPDLVFHIDGKDFSLPPESYMGNLSGVLSDQLGALMPHARERREAVGHSSCTLLLMTTDAMDDNPTWILGLPWFRKYYTTFELSADSKKASQIHVSPADSSCGPNTAEMGFTRTSSRGRNFQNVDASKVRAPAWVHHAQRRRRRKTRDVAGQPDLL